MNYPNGIKKKNDIKKQTTYGNRGMAFEEAINNTNNYYLINNIAVIHKKPTPITINKVDFNIKGRVIKEAYFNTPSTTDYNGIYNHKYIDFEAKTTKNKNSFPLSNIHPHQIKHLEKIKQHGGIGFILINFAIIKKTYLLTIEELITFIETNKQKSIPIKKLEIIAHEVSGSYNKEIDYLKIIDKIYLGKGD